MNPSKVLIFKTFATPEGVLVAYDSDAEDYQLFKFRTPLPPKKVDYPHRATAGSGSTAADIFLKNTEFLLGKIGYTWENLSTDLIAQYCFVLMQRIAYVEPNTFGLQVFRITKSSRERLTQDRVFGKLGKGDHYLRVLIESAIKEIGADKLAPIAEEYKLPSTIGKLLADSALQILAK